MRKLLFAAMAASSLMPFTVRAQEMDGTTSRIEPYVGVMGGYDDYDDPKSEHIPSGIPGDFHGTLVDGVAGINYNLGRLVVGVEGNAAKGIDGDIDWEYGVAGRAGVRLGKDSMFFGKVGYEWTNFSALGPDSGDYHDWTYGMGVELSPADMGMGGERSHIRFRGQIDTQGNFHSIRPMAGVVFKY